MKKILLLLFISFLLASCGDPVINSPGITFPSTARLDVYIYTLDAVTPNGTITLISTNNNTGEFETQSMTSESSSVPGASLWKGWVALGDLGTDVLSLSFENSNGLKALGLLKEIDPWWREVDNNNNDPYEIIDATSGIYKYVETIRHWENGTNGRSISLTGNVIDESSAIVTDFDVDIIPYHQVKPNSYFGYIKNLLSDSVTNSFFSEIDNIYTFSNETSLPAEDYLNIEVTKNFYSSYNVSYNYSVLHNLTALSMADASLIANRKITFDWIFSSTGVFTAGDSATSSIVNTVSAYDFTDWDLAQYFYSTFSDDALADSLNGYYFDDNQDIGIRLYTRNTNDVDDPYTYIYSTGDTGEVTEISSNGTISMDIDLSADPNWEWSVNLSETAGQVLGIRTTAGYNLVNITAIDIMTEAEMDQVIANHAAAAPSPSMRSIYVDQKPTEVRQ